MYYHQKQAEAKHREGLIREKMLVVGSDSWSTKMRTVHATKAKAGKLFKQAMRLKEEAARLDRRYSHHKRHCSC
jgi:hypothetical protein